MSAAANDPAWRRKIFGSVAPVTCATSSHVVADTTAPERNIRPLLVAILSAFEGHSNEACSGSHRLSAHLASRPANVDGGRWFGHAEDRYQTILAPVTRAGMDFASRTIP